jgi:hypothetical protein
MYMYTVFSECEVTVGECCLRSLRGCPTARALDIAPQAVVEPVKEVERGDAMVSREILAPGSTGLKWSRERYGLLQLA